MFYGTQGGGVSSFHQVRRCPEGGMESNPSVLGGLGTKVENQRWVKLRLPPFNQHDHELFDRCGSPCSPTKRLLDN